MQRRHLSGVQYLRAVACLAVVAFHSGYVTGVYVWAGQAGVDLFFVLSGFLMVAITDETSSPLGFLRDRFLRIAPIYWVATSVLVLGVIGGLFPPVPLEPGYVLSSYLFLPSFVPGDTTILPLLTPGWTLVYEMFFYLCFAALLLTRLSEKRRLAALTAGFVLLFVAGRVFSAASAFGITYTQPILFEFVMGMWIAYWWKRVEWPADGAIAIGGVGALILAGEIVTGFSGVPARPIFYGIPAAMLLAGIVFAEKTRPLPRWRFAHLLGDASYSIYLWHTLAISIAVRIAVAVGMPPLAALLFAFVTGTAAGLVLYFAIERPLAELSRDLKARLRARGAAALSPRAADAGR